MQPGNSEQALRLQTRGTLLYSRDQLPMSKKHWLRLKELAELADYEYVVGGDADESHSVRVARFVNDVDRPTDLSELSAEVRSIVMSKPMLEFYSRFTGTPRLCLRRCQANRLGSGDFIGVHKDQDSNPDYLATAVFHFNDDYQGGDFITHDEKGSASYHPQPFTVLVNNCEIPHEVTRVEAGSRLTLACFLSREFGDSHKTREAFRLSY